MLGTVMLMDGVLVPLATVKLAAPPVVMVPADTDVTPPAGPVAPVAPVAPVEPSEPVAPVPPACAIKCQIAGLVAGSMPVLVLSATKLEPLLEQAAQNTTCPTV
jgi:hypothetical protein